MRIFHGPFLVGLEGYVLDEGVFEASLQVGVRLPVKVSVSIHASDWEWGASVGGTSGEMMHSPDDAVEDALRAYCAQHVKWELSELPVLDDLFQATK